MYQAQHAASLPLTARQVVTLVVSLALSFIGLCLLQATMKTNSSAHELGFGLFGVLLMGTGFAISLPGLLRTLRQSDHGQLR